MVVMAIMVVVSAFIMVNQQRFDSSTLLRSLGYSVALSVRQAQVYGSSVLGTTTAQVNCVGGSYASGACYANAYGIDFSAGSPSSYVLFADLDNNGAYTPGGTENIKIFNLGTGYTITNACALNGSNLYCTASCPATLPFNVSAANCFADYFTTLDIVFHRPNPDACFSTNLEPTACQTGGTPFYSNAYIEVSGGDNTRSVTISTTGEIAVGNAGS